MSKINNKNESMSLTVAYKASPYCKLMRQCCFSFDDLIDGVSVFLSPSGNVIMMCCMMNKHSRRRRIGNIQSWMFDAIYDC